MRALVSFLLISAAALAEPRPYRIEERERPTGTGALFRMLPVDGSTLECAGTITGSYAQTVTFTRATAALCTKADGTLVSLASGQPRIEPAGFAGELTATNLVLHDRDLSNAAWVKTTATCTKTATGTTGAANSASVCTASAGNATVLQTVTTGAATRATSLYLKRRTGTGTVEVTRNNGTNWTAVTLSSTAWTRFAPNCAIIANCTVVSALTSGIANPIIGIRIVTSGDAVDVDFVQDEAGAIATAPIETGAASATRDTEYATIAKPAGLSESEGCAKVCVTPQWTGGAPVTSMWLDFEPTVSNRRIAYTAVTADLYLAFNGTVNPQVAAGFTAGVTKCYLTQWSVGGNYLRVVNLNSGASASTAFAGFAAFDANLYINGAQVGGFAANARLSGIVIGNGPDACQ